MAMSQRSGSPTDRSPEGRCSGKRSCLSRIQAVLHMRLTRSDASLRQLGFCPLDRLPHLLAQRLNLGWRQLSHARFTVVRHGRVPLWPAVAKASASLKASSWKATMCSASPSLISAHIRLTWAGLLPDSSAVLVMLWPDRRKAITWARRFGSARRPRYLPASFASLIPWRCRSRRSRAICRASFNSMSCTDSSTILATPRVSAASSDR